jgi:hypothetical protein
MRMPSASFFQRSAFLLSSSSAVLEYMEKSGPELSPKLDFSCDVCNDRLGPDCWGVSIYIRL